MKIRVIAQAKHRFVFSIIPGGIIDAVGSIKMGSSIDRKSHGDGFISDN
jgi:hypothetical protein